MSKTLLYTVQRVLEKLDLDPVNSISDAVDATLIAREAETTYFDLISRADWPEKFDIVSITSGSDEENPTKLIIEDAEIIKIKFLKYDCTAEKDTNTVYKTIKYLDPTEFLDMSYARNTSNTNVFVANHDGIDIFVLNDTQPTYFTTFDNTVLILDSWDQDVEDTLVGTKAVCLAKLNTVWQPTDLFEIPLSADLYNIYLAELASTCSLYLNDAVLAADERRVARGMARLRRESSKVELPTAINKFGRLGNGRI